jgi:hypothetical protein
MLAMRATLCVPCCRWPQSDLMQQVLGDSSWLECMAEYHSSNVVFPCMAQLGPFRRYCTSPAVDPPPPTP